MTSRSIALTIISAAIALSSQHLFVPVIICPYQCNRPICQAFTVFGILLMEPQLYTPGGESGGGY